MTFLFRAFVAVTLGTFIASASELGSFDRTLPVSGPVELDVQSNPGGMTINASSDGTVHIHAVIKPLYGRYDLDVSEANIRALEKNPPIEQVGNRIRIGYVKNLALLRGITMQIEIETPRATQVLARTDSGGIRIDGIQGPVDSTTSSGRTEISNIARNVKATGHSGAMIFRAVGGVFVRNQSGGVDAKEIRGAVDTETSSGQTEIRDVSHDVHVITQSGGVRLDDVKGSVGISTKSGRVEAFQLAASVRADTKSGAITVSQANPAAMRLLSESGAINVQLAQNGGYSIDAQSRSGRILGSATDNRDGKINSHAFRGQIGSGGPLVDLDTQSSRIEIR